MGSAVSGTIASLAQADLPRTDAEPSVIYTLIRDYQQAMTSHTCVLFDLPTQRDGEENKLRDETQQSTLKSVKGRFWCFFMELKTWAPVTAPVRVDPRALDIMT